MGSDVEYESQSSVEFLLEWRKRLLVGKDRQAMEANLWRLSPQDLTNWM